MGITIILWITLKEKIHKVCLVELTNQLWFSVVCTLIYNDMHHPSGQNVVDSQGRVFFTTITMSKKMFFQRVTNIMTQRKSKHSI